MYLQHTDPELAVPQHISRIGVITAHTFLATSTLAYKYKMYYATGLLLSLYTTSILHWRKLKNKGIIRTLDMIVAISTITRITFVDSLSFKSTRWIWLSAVSTGILAFIANEKLFYNQIIRYSNQIIEYPKNVNHWLFSFQYTNPNTKEREHAYYRSVLMHCFFQHIVPSFACAYAAIKSI